MKIICPEHKGYVGVPDEDLTYARINPSKILVLNCPVCHAEVQIRNIARRIFLSVVPFVFAWHVPEDLSVTIGSSVGKDSK